MPNTKKTEARIAQYVEAELEYGDARSAVYKLGMTDVLRLRMLGIPIPIRFQPGTVEFDAYYSGNERGHLLWQSLRDGGTEPLLPARLRAVFPRAYVDRRGDRA